MVRDTAYGRPGTEVIPFDWAVRMRPTAAGTMLSAKCQVRMPDVLGDLDETTNQIPKTPGALLYPLGDQDGRCRVQRLNRERVPLVGEERVTVVDYLVTIEFPGDDIEPGCMINFTTIDDGDLQSRRLAVTAVLRGSLRWERDLYCIDEDA